MLQYLQTSSYRDTFFLIPGEPVAAPQRVKRDAPSDDGGVEIKKRHIVSSESEVVSLRLGVRGLVVGENSDIENHQAKKREAQALENAKSRSKRSVQEQKPEVNFFSGTHLLGGAALMAAVVVSLGYVWLKKRPQHRVINIQAVALN